MTKRITHSSQCISSVLKQKMKLLVVATALLTGGLQAQTVVLPTITTPGAGTWTVPAGIDSITVQCWSGGGAGGSAEVTATITATVLRGGGGAGGSFAGKTIAVTPGQVLNYSVGAGGTAPATGFANDTTSNGQNTTFGNSEVVAQGGPGGQSKTASTAVSAGGAGGIAPTTGNVGDVVWYGGNGYAGNPTNAGSNGSGPGGGSAGSLGNGGNALRNSSSALGGTAGLGGGVAGAGYVVGASAPYASAGNTGGNPGAGGSGASIRIGTAVIYRSGGNGGNGQIIITYTGGPSGLSTVKTNAFVTLVGKNLLLNGDVNAVEVYNAQGKMIHSQANVTSVNGLTNGIYIVKMQTPQGVNVQKVSIR